MFRININRMQMSDIDFQIQKDVLARFSLKIDGEQFCQITTYSQADINGEFSPKQVLQFG